MHISDYRLIRNAFDRLILIDQAGSVGREVVPVRAFPVSDPSQGIALMDMHGHELLWIDNLQTLPENYRKLIEAELASREFMPELKRIIALSGPVTPNTWFVETDRGDANFILRSEEEIRRLGALALMITDQYGVHFFIKNRTKLDRRSRKLLDHFL